MSVQLFRTILTLCLVAVNALTFVAAAGGSYAFFLDNDQIFDDCPPQPDVIGINEAMNMSEATYDYVDGLIHVSGSVTCNWKGVEPTDRLEFHGEVYKFVRGTWQSTLISVHKRDYCKVILDPSSITYQVWTTHVREEDRICVNNYGHTYHYIPFTANTKVAFGARLEGRHRIVIQVAAFDKNNVKRKPSVCVQIFGEYLKVQ